MTLILVILALIGTLTVFYNFWLFDCIIEWEFEHHRDQWERDDKPRGFLRSVPKVSAPGKNGSAEQRLFFIWLFKTPAWSLQSSECRRWFVRRRIIAAATNLIILVLLLKLL
jgi:hypothetical protein